MPPTRHPLEVRDRHHIFDDSIPKFFDSGNAVLTHEWNALSLIIPSGERYFIRSVQRLASRAKDPGLKAQIKGFIGQEAIHAREVSIALDPIAKRGFPVLRFERGFDRIIGFLERWIPWRKGHLAVTAGIEHYTAALSIWHLSNRYCDRCPATWRDLQQWHAAEELEHKAVAFDLFQELAPKNYPMRVAGFFVGITVVWLAYRRALRMLLKWEGLSRAQIRDERRRARKIRIPLLSWGFPRLLEYLKPGFHPNNLDDGNLSKEILGERAVVG